MYEKIVWNGATEEKTYIGPSTVVYRGTNRDVRYLHVDRLGSVEAVTTSTAASMFLTGTIRRLRPAPECGLHYRHRATTLERLQRDH